MQTRKRNIDSVLNLVNPKRLKKLNLSPKKETDSVRNTSKKDKQAKPAIKSASAKKERSKKKPVCVTEFKSDTQSDEGKKTAKYTDKPFKKRPLPNTTTDISECFKTDETNNVHSSSEQLSGENEKDHEIKTVNINLKVLVKDNEQTDGDGANKSSDGKSNVEKTNKEPKININSAPERNKNESARNGKVEKEKNSITVDVKDDEIKSKQKGKEAVQEPFNRTQVEVDLVHTATDEEDLSDEDEEFIDAGAIEDDRDIDFVVPKKEPDDDVTGYQDHKQSYDKTTQVNVIDMKDIKLESDDEDIKKKPVCELCGKAFANKFGLKKHMITHSGEKPYECKVCGFRFGLKSQLNRHKDTHLDDSNKPFLCTKCPKSFSRKSSLVVHQITHQDERPFTCPICFKLFKRELSFKEHYKVHEHGQMYMCQFCGKSFGFRASLAAHIAKHSEEKPYVCTECGKGYYSKQSFREHNLRHQKLKEVVCQVCDRRFYNKKELQKHLSFHNTVTEFQCVPCKMYFKDEHCMRIHNVKLHSKEYACEFCDAKFTNLRQFKTHTFRQHRELRNAKRPKMPMNEKANFKHVLCDFCGKELSNKYRLNKHLVAKHSGMKRQHRRRVTNEARRQVKLYPSGKKVLCTICNKVMFNKYKLYKHMEKMHDIPLEEIQKIELVRLDEETETELNVVKSPKEVDVQTIVIKPMEAVEIGEEQSVNGGSTVHYLDAHGNIIYSDTSFGKMYDYIKMDPNDESIQINTSGTSLLDTAQNIVISKPNSDGVISTVVSSTKPGGVSFPKNIVDFAVQAAKIVDIDESMAGNDTVGEHGAVNEQGQQIMISTQESGHLPTDTDNNTIQDITYIVQQATNRIAAHEKSRSSESELNQSEDQDGIKLIVNETENVEAVPADCDEQNVKYIIDESGELSRYVVKEECADVVSGDLVLAGDLETEQQKIIIIDEQGGEQVISTGPSEQIKISFDPETGLYSYITEEVVVQQEDGDTAVEQLTDNPNYDWVILSEDDIAAQSTTPQLFSQTQGHSTTQDHKMMGQGSNVHVTSDVENKTHFAGQDIGNIGLDGQVVRHVIDKTANLVTQKPSMGISISTSHDVTIPKPENTVLNSDSNNLTEQIQGLPQDSATHVNRIPVSVMQQHSTGKGPGFTRAKTQVVCNTSLTGNISENDNGHLSDMITGVSSSFTQIPKTPMLLSTEAYNYTSTQPTHLIAGAPDLSGISSSHSPDYVSSSMTVFSASETPGFASVSDFTDDGKSTQIHIPDSETHLDTGTIVQIPMNDASSQMLEDISQSVLSLEQNNVGQKSDYSNLVYNKSLLNLDSGVTITAEDQDSLDDATHGVENVTYIVDNDTVGVVEMGAVMSEVDVMETDSAGNKRDLIQLENMLKTGINDVSNTVEYTNFLDRMINHLQSAKADVTGKPTETEGDEAEGQ